MHPIYTKTAEHLLAVLEPVSVADETLSLAREVKARGGRVSVLILITNRVRQDIREFADAENLDYWTAEGLVIDRIVESCAAQVGADAPVDVLRAGRFAPSLKSYIGGDVDTVAVPASVFERKELGRLARTIGRRLIISPEHAA